MQKYIMNLSNTGTPQKFQDKGYEILGPLGSYSPIINCSALSPSDGLVRRSLPACGRVLQPRLMQGHARLPDLQSYRGRKLRQLISLFFSVVHWSSSCVFSHCACGRGKQGRKERCRVAEPGHREDGKGEQWEYSLILHEFTIGILLWH